jgi:N utilization substance protein A
VSQVRIDEETGTAEVIVPDYQLSLAIGKEGQNARLAARLTGWRVDIKSETQHAEEEAGYTGEEWAQGEWVTDDTGAMVWQPAEGGEGVSVEEWSKGDDGDEEPPPPAGDVVEVAGVAGVSAPDAAAESGAGESAAVAPDPAAEAPAPVAAEGETTA